MSLLKTILDAVSTKSLVNIGNLTSESPDSILNGLKLVISSLFTSVLRFSEDKSAADLSNILTAGGHSGDILNNFESFSGSPEKMNLLETIGSNISRHFMGDDLDDISQKISNESNIKQSSALSLISFASPLVLGALGKSAKNNKLSDQELMNLLKNEVAILRSDIPSDIAQILQLDSGSRVLESSKKKQIEWIHILPWVFLAFLAVGVYYFSQKDREPSQHAEVIPENRIIQDSNFKAISENVSQKKESELKEASPIKKSEVVNTAPKVESVAIESRITVDGKKTQNAVNNTGNKTRDVRSASGFAYDSAEITSEGSFRSILNRLNNNPDVSIRISPSRAAGRLGEDRAYALRDWLIEKGIPLNRIQIGNKSSQSSDIGFSYTIE